MKNRIKVAPLLGILLLLALQACSTPVSQLPTAIPSPSSTATLTNTVASTETVAATASSTQTLTLSPTITRTPTITVTPTITETLTITPSPTKDFPDATVLEQANCRYGPGTAYLYSHGLYAGDKAQVDGKNWSGSWLWIKPENLNRHCWVSEIVVEVVGDINTVPVVTIPLPHTTFAGPPNNVQAFRDGNHVTVTWNTVELSEDKRRGYLIEATTCQNGNLLPLIVRTDDTTYTFDDEETCAGPSGGWLYTAEKHGYSDPVQIPWP